jgi:hypothetical protein
MPIKLAFELLAVSNVPVSYSFATQAYEINEASFNSRTFVNSKIQMLVDLLIIDNLMVKIKIDDA